MQGQAATAERRMAGQGTTADLQEIPAGRMQGSRMRVQAVTAERPMAEQETTAGLRIPAQAAT